ncbi:vegetative cell wall protein gp1-like [Iris pallida]|uniref:Vegetative cell wall protein gp1-like n=1 Tax=Iris pallida TaxID=29817 RepID=A0AAX6EQB0_IRIPA|nr:vegetative cell wall protein gp1-like [Iris pallida]
MAARELAEGRRSSGDARLAEAVGKARRLSEITGEARGRRPLSDAARSVGRLRGGSLRQRRWLQARNSSGEAGSGLG